MKTTTHLLATFGLAFLATVGVRLSPCRAATTIDPVNKYAYGANIGWLDAYADGANGAVIGEYVCSGYIYAANVGWINLGSGTPANQIQYQNSSAADFGVNHDGLGNLRGYAYGANIGWVNFENTGAPKVDLLTGFLSGSVWSANCGWISLSNAVAFVQTDTIAPGADSDGDGIADAWELLHFGNLTTANATSDYDRDGSTDLSEYLAGTDPLDPNSFLRITDLNAAGAGTTNTLTWTSVPTRQYRVLQTSDVAASSPWIDIGLGLILPDAGSTTTRTTTNSATTQRYFRVEAIKPLSP